MLSYGTATEPRKPLYACKWHTVNRITDLSVAGNDLTKWHALVDMEELKNDLPEIISDVKVGLLTRKGQQQLESLGAALRKIYVEQLGAVPGAFDEDLISLRSTNFS